MYNFMVRVVVRGGYTIISTFVACLLPFFGDFISLTGSLCMMPLDLVLVLALFVKVSFCPTFSLAFRCLPPTSSLPLPFFRHTLFFPLPLPCLTASL